MIKLKFKVFAEMSYSIKEEIEEEVARLDCELNERIETEITREVASMYAFSRLCGLIAAIILAVAIIETS